MRLVVLATSVLLLSTGVSQAGSDIREHTTDNVESQSFEFKFKRTDYWFCTVVVSFPSS
jgi:hypothetical protein